MRVLRYFGAGEEAGGEQQWNSFQVWRKHTFTRKTCASKVWASLTLIQNFLRRLAIVQKAMKLIFGYTLEHTSRSEDETTAQLIGIRLFNAASSGVKLALSGYYQTAFHQARDIMETGYLLDYFRTFPAQRAVWKRADDKKRKELFDPVKIRIALDQRDNDLSKRRATEYKKLSELATHATFRGFVLTRRGGFGELGPFVEKVNLLAWLQEMVLRLGPSAVMYANQFPGADPRLIHSFQEFGTELVQGFLH
jgi:hypothetical protein